MSYYEDNFDYWYIPDYIPAICGKRDKEKVWVTAREEEIKYSKLTTQHIHNIINKFKFTRRDMPNLLKELDKRNRKSKPKSGKDEFGLKTLIYRKLYSLSPDLYKEIDSVTALHRYTDYLDYFSSNNESMLEAKTFREWLESEI